MSQTLKILIRVFSRCYVPPPKGRVPTYFFYVDPVSVGISVGVHSYNFIKIILLSANEEIPLLSALGSASAWCFLVRRLEPNFHGYIYLIFGHDEGFIRFW